MIVLFRKFGVKEIHDPFIGFGRESAAHHHPTTVRKKRSEQMPLNYRAKNNIKHPSNK